MKSIVSSEVGSIGCVMHGCNEQSRRSRGCGPETKPVALAIRKKKMERGLQEFLSIGQVVIVLSCQLVMARKMPTAETADQSYKLNVRYVRTYSVKVFPSPIYRINSFSKKAKNTSSKCKSFFVKLRKFFRNLLFPSTFSKAICQNVHTNTLIETQLVM